MSKKLSVRSKQRKRQKVKLRQKEQNKRTVHQINEGKNGDMETAQEFARKNGAKVSQTFIIKMGHVGQHIKSLVSNLKLVMSPYTAAKLKEKRKNTLQDFKSVAGPLGVTHFMVLSQTDTASYLRMCKLPQGPTLTFRITSFSLMADITRITRSPVNISSSEFFHPPLVVLNNFSGLEHHVKLTAVMLQNLFPTINVNTVKLSECKRIVLLDLNKETGDIEFRHFRIKASPVGLSKGVKRITQYKIPNLGQMSDISDYVLSTSKASESDIEDADADNKVVLPSDALSGKSVKKKQLTSQTSIRLQEIGPRMTLQLHKIQDGFCDGAVMYHKIMKKTNAEKKELERRHAMRKTQKELRKKQQEENVARKERLRSSENTGDDTDDAQNTSDNDDDEFHSSDEGEEDGYDYGASTRDAEEDLTDADYYRQEVGEEPDEGIFGSNQGSEGSKKEKKEQTHWFKLKREKLKAEKKSDDDDNTNTNTNADESGPKKRKREEDKTEKIEALDKNNANKKAKRREDWYPANIPASRLKSMNAPRPKIVQNKKLMRLLGDDKKKKKQQEQSDEGGDRKAKSSKSSKSGGRFKR